jgi:hypothetical protein
MKAAVTAAAVLAVAVISPTEAPAAEPLGSTAQRLAPVTALQPLNPLIGSWTCSGTTTSPDGSKQAFDTSSTAKFILGGNFMRWQEENSVAGTVIGSAEYIWGWDAQHNDFTLDRFDSSGQRGAQTTPGWAGNVLTSTGNLVQPDGTAIPLTTTITRTAKAALSVRAVVNLGAGITVVSESSCTR